MISKISEHALLLAVLSLTVAMSALPAKMSHAQRLFSFADDFHKPPSCQRNPWEERIETERHDFTQSAITVGRGVVQVESGYTYFYKDDEVTEGTHATPEMLLRMGISEDVELRLRFNHLWTFIEEEPDESGTADLILSIKLQITRGEVLDLLPTSALQIRGSAPTGGRDYSTQGYEFGLDYIYEWGLSDTVKLAGSTGFGSNALGESALYDPNINGGDQFVAILQSAAFGMELSEQNTLYVEWYGFFTTGAEDSINVSVLNTGIDHYITENFVVDARVGVGMTEDSDDFFSGVGGGFRF